MKNLKHFVLVMCLFATSGCAFVGGFFDKKEDCHGAACSDTRLTQTPTSGVQWYCYGKEDGSDWQCVDKPDPSKKAKAADTPTEASIQPRTSTPAALNNPAPALPTEPPGALPNVITSDSGLSGASRHSLMEQPRGAFAVQLVALPEEENVLKYAKSNGIVEPLYARINNQGSDWYVLLLGVYENRAAAIEAKESWVRSNNIDTKPWIRELGPLQDAVRAATDG